MDASAQARIEELRGRLVGGYQLLQTLVGIRLRAVSDPESRRHMAWLSDIVAALGLLSRRLVEQGPVDFEGYLEDAADFWRRSLEGRPVKLEVRGGVRDLPDTHVAPLAIIVHELIGNAVRHAFPEDGRGSIAVAFSQAAGGVNLVVRDSGVGGEALTLGEGLLLVQGLVEHLGGSMTIETAPGQGVGVRIRLPLDGRLTH